MLVGSPLTEVDALLRRTAVIVLAAGRSQRLGVAKQFVQVEGETLIVRTVRTISQLEPHLTVVVSGENAAAIADQLAAFRCLHVRNDAPECGLSSSLRRGLCAALAADPELQAVLFTLCDQPYLDVQQLRELMAGLARGHAMAASAYAGELGVPAAFRRSMFDELTALSGDRGARQLLRQDRARVAIIAFPAGATDVDLPEDVIALQQGHQARRE
jgi:molybdenum cofactor cytidylyltransferase